MRKRLAIALILLAAPAAAQSVTIIDGDKINIDGAGYRFLGVAAPDPGQVCDDGYPVGTEAIKALLALMSGRKIACEARGREPSGRLLAICRANGRDLGEAMVRAGMAWPDPRTGRDYVVVEHDARADRLGVHDHSCVLPWAYKKNPG
ncbi:MAG: thermonuclease family protein [Enhydrobacter sp.]